MNVEIKCRLQIDFSGKYERTNFIISVAIYIIILTFGQAITRLNVYSPLSEPKAIYRQRVAWLCLASHESNKITNYHKIYGYLLEFAIWLLSIKVNRKCYHYLTIANIRFTNQRRYTRNSRYTTSTQIIYLSRCN